MIAKIRYLQSSAWQIFGNFWIAMMSFFSASIIARMLGVETYGLLNYIITYVYIFIFLAKMGVGPVLNRELSHSSSQLRSSRILFAGFRIQLAGACFAYVVMLGLAYYTEDNPLILEGIAILGLVFFGRLAHLFEFVYNSQVRGNVIGISHVISVTVGTAGKVLCLFLGFGLKSILWFSVIEALIAGTIYLVSKPGTRAAPPIKGSRFYDSFVLKNAWPLLVSSGAVVLYQRIDIVMLKSMASFVEVGQYAVGVKFFTLINLIPVSLAAALSPMLFKSRKKGTEEYGRSGQLFLDLCFWSSCLPCLCFVFLAPKVVPLIFGDDYLPAVYLSQIIVWRTIFTGMGVGTGQLILAEGMQHLALFRTFGGLAVNVLLNLFWIPQYGAVGASYGTLISFFVANWLMHALVPRFRPLWRMQILTLVSGLVNIYRFSRKFLISRNHV